MRHWSFEAGHARRALRRFGSGAVVALLLLAGAETASAGFANRKLVTIAGSQVVGGPHANFPVLFVVVDPELRLAPLGGVRSSAGCDVSFRASDGVTPLDYDIVTYDGATGAYGAYVRLPSIQNGVSTQFYVYYGDPKLSCIQTRHGDVWDAGYRAVLPLTETSGNPVDLTSNGVAGRLNPQGDPGATIAQTGQALQMILPPSPLPATFIPTTDSHLQLADGTLAANSPFTFEAMFYYEPANTGQFVGLVTKNRDNCNFPCDQPGEDWVGMEKLNTDRLSLIMDTDGGPGNLVGATVLASGRWYYGAVSSNGVNTRRVILYDGVDAVDAVTPAGYTALANPTRVGDDSNGNYLVGMIAQLRISTVERSAAWLQTTARTLLCSTASASPPSCVAPLPASLQIPFMTVGAQQAVAAVATTSDCCSVTATDDGTRVTALTSALSMVFDRTDAGGLTELRNEEEANRTQSRNGDTTAYNVFSTQVNDSTNTWHYERSAAGQIQVLEATPTRLRLHQRYDYMPSVHLQRAWTVGAMPRLAIDERLVVDSTQDLRGAQGLHPRGATSGGATICPSQLITSGFGSYFYCNAQENSTDRFFLVTDDHETYSDMLAVAYTTPFFGPTRAGTGGNYQHLWEPGTPETFYSRVHEPTRISTSAGTYRNLYMFYPSLAGLTSAGTQWQPYANDYRTPDVLSFNVFGTGWFDAGDLTVSPNDYYNEAEGAYQVDFNPASGLSVNIDGNATTRYRPLFKIRQWRSFTDPIVTFEGTALVSDRDFTADVMPFARAFHCTGPTEFAGCTALANGGLVSTNEYLNDASGGKNYTLAFPDASTWLYFAAEAKFRGINVRLATLGLGTADLQWEYWNGASWLNLEGTLGWNDATNNLKAHGTISWGQDAGENDPIGWTTLSIGGSPSLYFVRARMGSGSYTTPPVELVMRTDILLFQYCRDVSILDGTFAFSVPPTTAVELQSFRAVPGDASVALEWRTASELANLGFHLYRGASADGPWTRLNPSLIPGLGSSPTGKSYSFQDAGLANDVAYFYRLEDVDASSLVTSHGPVSAVPTAASTGGPAGDGKDASAKRTTSPSCPSWVLAAHGSLAGASGAAQPSCTRHGDPEAASLEVVSREARSVTLELRTPGFYALHTESGAGEASGSVRVFVPGFDFPQDEQAAALPLRRALVEAVAGRRVALGSVRSTDLASFSLVPAALGRAEMQVGRDGTVRAGRRAAPAPRSFPRGEIARLLPSVFQGESKSAVVLISPLRYDPGRRQLTLARRVLVRLTFAGREPGESGRGFRGRARVAPTPPASGEVLSRLYTGSRGLYAASFEQLFPGRPRGFAASELRLERQGVPVAFHLEPDADGFGPGSRLYFFADAVAESTAFSGEVAHELVHSKDGVRMALVSGAATGDPVAGPATGAASFETNRFYQPGLLDAVDPWLWESLPGGAMRTIPFALVGVDGQNAATARLDVFLQGASESGQTIDHHVSVSVNGVLAGAAQFAGKRPYRVSLEVPASLLHEGANELTLSNLADTGVTSFVFLDRFSLAYPQTSSFRGGVFEGAWAGAGTASLSGAAGPALVLDVTAEPRLLARAEAAAGSLRFRADASRRYLGILRDAVPAPRVESPAPSTLQSAANQADYLLIAPRAFLAAAEPLVERRRGQGLTARAVAFEEIAEAFGHGQPSAEAIRSFLAFTFHSWARPSPRYVLLVGDSSYDPRHFMASSGPSPLPALWARTSYLFTVSDPLLAAVNGDDALPDLAIGRLPAATVEEAHTLVDKLVAWEDSGQGFTGSATLVADNPDAAGDFEADAQDIASSFFPGRSAVLRLGELGAATRPRIQDALDSGLSFLSYVGHGGAAVWASENVWNSWDAASLQAQSQQPLLVTMNCLNGYFVAPAFDSLAESLLKAEGRGAVAAISPSGLSLDGPAHQFHRALMGEITGGTHARLGDAVLAAQADYVRTGLMPELVSVYHLFGDPATPIR